MRALLWLLALGVGGYAAHQGFLVRTAYGGHSTPELEALSYESFQSSSHTKDFRKKHEAEAINSLISEELTRRRRFHAALAGTGVLVLGALVWPRRRKEALSFSEEERFLAAVGDPGQAMKETRHQAELLLGLGPQATASEIESAFRAQLEARNLHRLEDTPPENPYAARNQLEALERARDVLLGKTGAV